MELMPESNDLKDFLDASEIVDHEDRNIQELASLLSTGATDDVELARRAYEYVRDSISHSFDINGTRITCKASDVLK